MFKAKTKSDTFFEVQKVIAKKIKNGIEHYKVIWKGYSSDQGTWQPKNNLHGCTDLIRQFQKKIHAPKNINASIFNGIREKFKLQNQNLGKVGKKTQQKNIDENYPSDSASEPSAEPSVEHSEQSSYHMQNQKDYQYEKQQKNNLNNYNGFFHLENKKRILDDNKQIRLLQIINVAKSEKDHKKVGYFEVYVQGQQDCILVPRRRMLRQYQEEIIKFYESLILWDNN